MSADKSFRGTLLLLQNKTKRDPESYVDEFRTQLKHFEAVCRTLLQGTSSSASSNSTTASSANNPQFLAVMHFICQVAFCYPKECGQLPQLLIDLLRQGKGTLPVDTRSSIVTCLLLLRSKNLASAQETMPVLFELLEARDKGLRKTILSHVVADVRRINLPGAKAGSAAVNKQIQNFLFKIMEDDDPVQARSALVVMIDLYRRQLWCTEKTVAVISKACFSKHTLILRMALHFFMMQMPKFSSVGSDDDPEDDIDPGRLISKLKHKLKHKSKTVHREKVLKSKVDTLKKRFDADKREEDAFAKQQVDPLRLMNDPQGFAERLLAKLSRTTERFEVRILMMSVLARVINEHDLVLLQVYPMFERYFEPTQLHATNILALASTCVHPLIPPEPVESMIRTIADRFVNDRSDRDSITIGINTIREMCKRQPMAMNADLLADLVAYRQRRGERGVIMAARALLQLYREVNPELLPTKLRGGVAGAAGQVTGPRFGAPAPLREIPGLESLFGAEDEANDDIANSEDLDETESSVVHFTTDSDDTSADGEWQLVSDDEEGDEFDDDEITEEEIDEVPQLVPIRGSASGARIAKVKSSSSSGDDEECVEEDDEEEEGEEEEDGIEESCESSEECSEQHATVARRSRPAKAIAANGFNAADDMWGSDDEDATQAPTAKKARAERRPAEKITLSEDEESEDGDADDEDAVEEDVDGSDADDEESDEIEETSDDDSDSSSGSGEWVDVSHSDDDESHVAEPLPEVASEAAEAQSWYEAGKVGATSMAGRASTAAKGSVASQRVLTDVEFAQLRALQSGQPLKGKKMTAKVQEKKERQSRKDALVHDLGEKGKLLDSSFIETFTSKKRDRDREKKIEEAKQKRIDNNPFQARKKKKTKLTTTHREKQKAGKLYQMTKRSARVAEKIKRSVQERQEHAKDMKKKSIKFRIARGWKA